MFAELSARCPMIETLRRNGARGPWLGILRELVTLGGTETQFVRHTERPWSSNMFSGARHVFTLVFEGGDAVSAGETLIAALPDHEFRLPGRLVADATISAVEHNQIAGPRMTIEAELLVLDET